MSILCPPVAKNWLIGKDTDAGKDWRQEEKGMTEDEMVDGITDSLDMSLGKLQEGVDDGQESLVCFSPLGHKELDITKRLNWYLYLSIFISISIYKGMLCSHKHRKTNALCCQLVESGQKIDFIETNNRMVVAQTAERGT